MVSRPLYRPAAPAGTGDRRDVSLPGNRTPSNGARPSLENNSAGTGNRTALNGGRQASANYSNSTCNTRGRSRSEVGPSHAAFGLASTSAEDPHGVGRPDPKKSRKERGTNWSAEEIAALIEAMRKLDAKEAACIDKRHLMVPNSSKWLRISREVMHESRSTNHRDGPACKSKWNQLLPDYKRIVDFFSRTGTNDLSYWHMSRADKKSEGLPHCFPEDVFMSIHEWYKYKSTVQPAHTRDLMSIDDTDFQSVMEASDEVDAGVDKSNADADDVAGTAFSGDTEEQSMLAHSPTRGSARNPQARAPRTRLSSPSASAGQPPKYVLPPGVTPQLISSSDTGDCGIPGRPGSTGVRRITMSGHSIMAEATCATGNVMAAKMRAVAEAGRDLERSKIQVQLNLFDKQMEYNRERDRRLHENAAVINENAKLAIQKQGQVVQCLAHIVHVLRFGLTHRYTPPGVTKIVVGTPITAAPSTTDAATAPKEVSGETEDAGIVNGFPTPTPQ